MHKIIIIALLLFTFKMQASDSNKIICQTYEVSIEGRKPYDQKLCGSENSWISESCQNDKSKSCQLIQNLNKNPQAGKEINVERGNPPYVLCKDISGKSQATQIKTKVASGASVEVWQGMACYADGKLVSHRKLLEMHLALLKKNPSFKKKSLWPSQDQKTVED